ncbi:MAG TPA: hypothetical protein VJA66_17405 [Thermoanaerobaculia bacterium]
MKRIGLVMAWLSMARAVLPLEPSAAPVHTGLGLEVELEAAAPADVRQRVFGEIRATGVNVFALSLSWLAVEREPGKYDLGEILRSARLLRQSGAMVHLDLPIVAGRRRDVPADLDRLAFDDERFETRLGRLLAALQPALLDATTLSLGYGADAYFAGRKEELGSFLRLVGGVREALANGAPQLRVGVTTAAPSESVAPEIATALQEAASVSLFIYAPFERSSPFRHRPPDALDHDWKLLLSRARDRPVAFPEVSYSSSRENGSSPERQAEFIRRFRRFLSEADGHRLLFARYVGWRDEPPAAGPLDATPVGRRKAAFYANRGLQAVDGKAKPAWTEWVKNGR